MPNSCAGISLRGETARQHRDIIFAARFGLEEEIAKQAMQLVLYREALEAAGIEPPDRSGEELLNMWRACKAVTDAAHACVAQLGTSKELLASFR